MIVGLLLLWILMDGVCAKDTYSTESLLMLLPKSKEIKNWTMKESPQIFFADNLWEYINGAAPRYLKYDFKCVVTVEYVNSTSPSQAILVDIYDMGSVENAFGMYASERSADYHFINIGAEGYLEMPVLNFFKDRYYIKLTAYSLDKVVQDSLLRFAQIIERNIKGEAKLPAEIHLFPQKDLIAHSHQFYRARFLGVKGLNNWFTAEYKVEGKKLTLFLHPCRQTNPEVEVRYIGSILLSHGWKKTGEFIYTDREANKILIIKPGKSYIYGGMTDKINEPLLHKKITELTAS